MVPWGVGKDMLQETGEDDEKKRLLSMNKGVYSKVGKVFVNANSGFKQK